MGLDEEEAFYVIDGLRPIIYVSDSFFSADPMSSSVAWSSFGAPTKILAPMTGASDLAFRLLCRQHGAKLCFTPMMYATHYAASEKYRTTNFETCAEDRPLVAQFCANNVDSLVRAAELISPDCDGVDINLCWPEQKAKTGPFGAFLHEGERWKTAVAMVTALKHTLDIPISAKICLFPTIEETVQRAAELEAAGCSFITVHGRTREQGGKGAADWTAIKAVVEHVTIPVVANGGIASDADAAACLDYTGANAVMYGNAALADPTIFSGSAGNRGAGTCSASTGSADAAAVADGPGSAPNNGGMLNKAALTEGAGSSNAGSAFQVVQLARQYLFVFRSLDHTSCYGFSRSHNFSSLQVPPLVPTLPTRGDCCSAPPCRPLAQTFVAVSVHPDGFGAWLLAPNLFGCNRFIGNVAAS